MENGKGSALITGASSGLGLEYAKLLAADGHDLVLVARREEKLREVANDLQDRHGIRASVIAADLGEPTVPARLVGRLADEGVRIDHLINNAGVGATGPFAELDVDRQIGMIQVNVTALVHLTRLLVPDMIARGYGRILNVASTAGFQPGPGMAVYYATKGFVISFSEGIAHELRGTGVTVTCHCPGATATEFAGSAGNADSMLFRAGVADAASVARHGYVAMKSGRVLKVHGPLNWLAMESLRLSPRAAIRPLVAWINSKA